MPTRLTEHFTLEELSTTLHRGIDNTPPTAVMVNLVQLAADLEQVRHLLGDNPITISSGYRSPDLNKAVGGVRNSAHLLGYAADFNCYRFGDPIDICRALAASDLKFDQMIEEGTWVHLSFAPAMRQEILTKAEGGGYVKGLRP